ncbi:hypothetical protein [Propionicimonas sp.]|uniref:hypothetical protein n=1 Tax=Propionicimonas sp. TaxID=1955623 RepID=UPI0017B71918|nr:hypothetical protein [Propionicimonas sp.]MBU3976508.1 hypothetical protein [Actinomycetota bacterium]MBA3020347.1 hypothetical protein [Propionicimonas sp.]MBU3987340.1 hypothetical protein [Actinomycetota bacterium]MBU4007652.1 hypothetical protein [Actinomycetota bacterium]MBU4064433.1 hypothetical protein [Actinomycetota bacterium]
MGFLLVPGTPAVAEAPPTPDALLSEDAALALAKKTGVPVVASKLTTENLLVTADPGSGLLRAEISAGVARVKDDQGNWRLPSANLVPDGKGAWRTEAGSVPVTVSGGGNGPLAKMQDGAAGLEFQWAGALPKPIVAGNLATFAEVAPGVDLVVRAAVDGVESFLVVKSAEAATNPIVRSVPIKAVSAGMTASKLGNDAVAFSNPAGGRGFVVPPAYMWDSKGQRTDARLGELLEPANEATTAAIDASLAATTKAAAPTTRTASFAAIAGEAVSILEDPATVYPVVIDPAATTTQTYAVRVTEDFNKYNSDIGSRGKIGYNGWSSPYYKSRMYYQFNWPINTSGSRINSKQITAAEFQYLQTHSPQHSCTDNDFGPTVKVQFHNTISSSTTWSSQPGTHPVGSVTNDYAVGHEDYCNATYRQKWNVTTMAQQERADYDRQTFTVGIRSSDEGDKNGWREYRHNSTGDSPKMVVTYEPEPAVPANFAIANPYPGEPLVSVRADNTLSVRLATAAGYACRTTTACLKAEFTIKSGSTVVRAAALSAASTASGGLVAVPVNGLGSGSYTAVVRTYNVDTQLYSTAASFGFTVDLPPGIPTWSWVIPDGWTNEPTLPADTALQIQASRNPANPDLQQFCVYVDGSQVDANGAAAGLCAATDANGAATIDVGPFELGEHQVSVAAQDARSTSPERLDDPTQRTFSW